MTLSDHIAEYPLYIRLWLNWMLFINFAAALFLVKWHNGRLSFGRIETVWIIAAMIANGVFITWLFAQVGFVRLLGLTHIIFWTPLVIYLLKRLPLHPAKPVFGYYVRLLLVTISISLVIDFIDVGRYFLDV